MNNTIVASDQISTSATQDVARWYSINVGGATPALNDQGNVSAGNNKYVTFPAVDINANGDIGMTYLQSGGSNPATPGGAFNVRFDRYSPYFVQAKQYGLDLHPSDFYRFIYPFSEEVLQRIAYYFSDHVYSAEYIANVSKWSGRIQERVAYWRSRWSGSGVFPKLEWRTRNARRVVV